MFLGEAHPQPATHTEAVTPLISASLKKASEDDSHSGDNLGSVLHSLK
jgi:hypothetical protein